MEKKTFSVSLESVMWFNAHVNILDIFAWRLMMFNRGKKTGPKD